MPNRQKKYRKKTKSLKEDHVGKMRERDPTLARVEVTAEHSQSRIKERQKGKRQKYAKRQKVKIKVREALMKKGDICFLKKRTR